MKENNMYSFQNTLQLRRNTDFRPSDGDRCTFVGCDIMLP